MSVELRINANWKKMSFRQSLKVRRGISI